MTDKLIMFYYSGYTILWRGVMSSVDKWNKELELFEKGKSKYEWDEIEELVTDEFDDGKLTSDEFDSIMSVLMELDCGGI